MIHGLAVTRGIAIGDGVFFVRKSLSVPQQLIPAGQVDAEIHRFSAARDAVAAELERLRADVPPAAPAEVRALLDVHLLLLRDESVGSGVARWIAESHYNAEWALATVLKAFSLRFDEMQDAYLRARKPDIEQVVELVMRHLQGMGSIYGVPTHASDAAAPAPADKPLILVAHDLSPADLLQFRRDVFAGFVTDVGGQTGHTAIIARSLDIPAVVGARMASRLLRDDDQVVVDGDRGIIMANPPPAVLAGYVAQRRRVASRQRQLLRLRDTPAVTADGVEIALLANIESPADVPPALTAGAVGVGLFRSEFLFLGRQPPGEDEQYEAYRDAVAALHGLPITIRTADLGADKEARSDGLPAERNPALGLRGIRRSLAQPEVFLAQLRALLRAATLGPVNVLFPMLAHTSEIRQALDLVDRARAQLHERGQPQGLIRLGAMIEVPAAALSLRWFLPSFDFMSIGTNDLIQYTLAVDRSEEAVAHLFDPWHPAILRLLATTIVTCRSQGKEIAVCGELAGDPDWTALLLGLGLRNFSMHPGRIAAVKQQVLKCDTRRLAAWARAVVEGDQPALPAPTQQYAPRRAATRLGARAVENRRL